MSDDVIPQQVIMMVSIIAGLVLIYLTGFPHCAIFSVVAVLLAVVYGTNTLRYIGNYSLGTGIPSIVYLLATCGLIAMIMAMSVSNILNNALVFPVLSVIFAAILAGVVSLICRYVFAIEIDILTKSFVGLSVASNLAIMSLSSFLVSTYDPGVMFSSIISNGLILLVLVMCVMTIQNPYNSCMGPNEDQFRTLSLAISNTFLMLIVISIIGSLNSIEYLIYLAIGIIGWAVFFRRYYRYTLRQAAEIKYSGFWTKGDEGVYYDK